MNFLKITNSDLSFQCECCGSISDSKVHVELFENEDKLSEHLFYHDDHFGDSNWNGEKIYIWAYALKNLGYKLSYSAFLEIYSDASDFLPQFEQFYQEDNLQEIPVHVVYERDFYLVLGNEQTVDIKKEKIAFIDQPKEFQFSLNQQKFNLISNDYETLYETIVKNLARVSEIHINSDYEYDEREEY